MVSLIFSTPLVSSLQNWLTSFSLWQQFYFLLHLASFCCLRSLIWGKPVKNHTTDPSWDSWWSLVYIQHNKQSWVGNSVASLTLNGQTMIWPSKHNINGRWINSSQRTVAMGIFYFICVMVESPMKDHFQDLFFLTFPVRHCKTFPPVYCGWTKLSEKRYEHAHACFCKKNNFGCMILNFLETVHWIRDDVNKRRVAIVWATENERTHQLSSGFPCQEMVNS